MFDGSINFSVEIEKRVKGKNPSYMDAVMDVCESFEIEPQSVAKHLSKQIIEKIRLEALERNHRVPGKSKEKTQKLPL